jgi:hypothetical protein
VVAGALAGVIGERWTFGAVAVICGAIGARILVTGHRERIELDAALPEPA